MIKQCAAMVLALAAAAGTARAGEALVGVYGHDVTFIGKVIGVGAAGREGGADIQLGYRTDRIEGLRWLARPQAHALASVNTDGTSDFVAAGLSWPIRITDRVYFRPGLGLAYTDGETGLPPVNAPGLSQAEIARRYALYRTRIDFGSKVLFQPELGLGYRFSDKWAAELSYVHLSNGQILHHGKNQGLDDAGVRLVYSF